MRQYLSIRGYDIDVDVGLDRQSPSIEAFEDATDFDAMFLLGYREPHGSDRIGGCLIHMQITITKKIR